MFFFKLWADLSLKWKLLIFGCLGVVVMSISALWLTDSSGKAIGKLVETTMLGEAESQAKLISEGVLNLVNTQDKLLRIKLHGDLAAARNVLDSSGGVNFSSENIKWNAVNQFTQQSQEISLPKLTVGDVWLGQNFSSSQATPVVDKVKEMLGGTCTIFQRMNTRGDMLRVATNVIGEDGKRAIGTYIPAVNQDNTPNPVVSAVMRGETFVGRAQVVGRWYVAAYEPIKDSTGSITGMLYVGLPIDMVKEVTEAINSIKVGKTGYVFVLGGAGNQKHKTIIHKALGINVDLTDRKDSSGELFIQKMVTQALSTVKDGKPVIFSYPWLDQGATKTRDKYVALVYYEPWDWVIGASSYYDEFYESIAVINKSLSETERYQFMVTLVILLLVCLWR